MSFPVSQESWTGYLGNRNRVANAAAQALWTGCGYCVFLPAPRALHRTYGAVLRTALRRSTAGGVQALCVLGCEAGGCNGGAPTQYGWSGASLRTHRAWQRPRRRAAMLPLAVQQAIRHTALGGAKAMPSPAHADAPVLGEDLDPAHPESRAACRCAAELTRDRAASTASQT